MKHHFVPITLLTLAAIIAGCDSKTPSSSNTTGQIDKIKADTKQAESDLKDYNYAQRSEFVASMQAELNDLNREIDVLSAKVEKSNDAAKAEAQPKLQALRDQTAKLNRQLDATKDASESTWNDVKAGFNTGYAELKDGFNQARSWVSEKLAP